MKTDWYRRPSSLTENRNQPTGTTVGRSRFFSLSKQKLGKTRSRERERERIKNELDARDNGRFFSFLLFWANFTVAAVFCSPSSSKNRRDCRRYAKFGIHFFLSRRPVVIFLFSSTSFDRFFSLPRILLGFTRFCLHFPTLSQRNGLKSSFIFILRPPAVVTEFYWVLLGFYWVFSGFERFYWVLHGFTEFSMIILSVVWFYRVSSGFAGLYWVVHGFTLMLLGFYRH